MRFHYFHPVPCALGTHSKVRHLANFQKKRLAVNALSKNNLLNTSVLLSQNIVRAFSYINQTKIFCRKNNSIPWVVSYNSDSKIQTCLNRFWLPVNSQQILSPRVVAVKPHFLLLRDLSQFFRLYGYIPKEKEDTGTSNIILLQ